MDKQIDFRLTPFACFLGAAAMLMLPLRWIAGIFLAAAFHELCHYLALRSCRVPVLSFSVGFGGAEIETGPMSRWQEFLCAMAGPLGSFLLVLLHRWIPVTAICALIQGLFNLLPVFPSDGGRMVQCIAGNRISIRIGRWTTILMLGLGIYGFARLKLGLGVLIPGMILLVKKPFRKIPCKDGPLGVQ